MKSADCWIEEQSSNPPRTGSMEHRMMCDAVKAIQLDARIAGLKEAESVVKLCNGLFTLESGCERILGVAQSAILNRIRELEASPKKEGE